MTDARIADGIGFVGPYLYTEQDMLVRAGDPIDSLQDLDGKTVCTAASSTALTHLDSANGVRFKVVSESGGYQLCVNRLLHHTADALVTDESILVGYLHDPANAGRLRPVHANVGKSPERYGIGILAAGHQREAAAIERALAAMIADGSWQRLVIGSFCAAPVSYAHPCATARTFLRKPVPQVSL